MASCKECIHHDVCETFCGGIPRMQKFGDHADRDCGHFDRKLLCKGQEISKQRIEALIDSACKELDLSPTTLAKWRSCFVVHTQTGEKFHDGYMCTACGTRTFSDEESCSGCGAAMHGYANDVYMKMVAMKNL